ncbi:MAG: GNAT family N-acetyltransferase [Planctomycetota bacterium]|nr:MAG: GNAT family N-acetyltransferase [Planctomycetota bacterium]
MPPSRERITIRVMRPADYDAVCDVWRTAGLAVKPQGRDARGAMLSQLRRFPTTYLVAEAGARLVGVVLGTHDHRKGWINRLAVIPAYRGCGIAKRLIARCEQALAAMGIEIVSALVEEGNDASCATFRAAGYSDEVRVTYFRKLARPDI